MNNFSFVVVIHKWFQIHLVVTIRCGFLLWFEDYNNCLIHFSVAACEIVYQDFVTLLKVIGLIFWFALWAPIFVAAITWIFITIPAGTIWFGTRINFSVNKIWSSIGIIQPNVIICYQFLDTSCRYTASDYLSKFKTYSVARVWLCINYLT
jgi:hypothetical protein